MPGIHHLELWVSDLEDVRGEWRWLLTRLGFSLADDWGEGQSWAAGQAYLVLTETPNTRNVPHDRRRPGMNHIAFRAGSTRQVDEIMKGGPSHGWSPLYQERYPHAGGPDYYAGWLENASGYKVEVVADA